MTGYLFDTRDNIVHAKASDIPIDGDLQVPGGIYTSMNEMANYAKYLLNRGEFNGVQLLTPSSIEKLFSPQMPAPYGRGANP